MRTPFFQKINLNPSIKEEIIRVSDSVRIATLEDCNLDENNINFFSIGAKFDNHFNKRNEHQLEQLSDKSWQTNLDKKTFTNEYLDKFRFVTNFWVIYARKESSGFPYHRHHCLHKENARIPYLLMVVHGKKSVVELVEPLNYHDPIPNPAQGDLSKDVETKVVGQYEINDSEIYLMNSWIYHTLYCDDFVRISIWNPDVRNVYEANDYIDYLESLR